MTHDFKGPPRVRDAKATRRACLMWPWCPCGERAGSGHHVLGKGAPYFGDDVLCNIVPMCGDGVSGCHGRVENEDADALRLLGEWIISERRDVVTYIQWKLGPEPAAAWFERRLGVAL